MQRQPKRTTADEKQLQIQKGKDENGQKVQQRGRKRMTERTKKMTETKRKG